MSVNLLPKEKLDEIKANWDIPESHDPQGKLIELPIIQQLHLHLLEKIDELEARIKVLESR